MTDYYINSDLSGSTYPFTVSMASADTAYVGADGTVVGLGISAVGGYGVDNLKITVAGNVYSSKGNGVHFGSNSSLTVLATGQISGSGTATPGVFADGSDGVGNSVVSNAGTITSGAGAVYMVGGGNRVVNTGSIIETGSDSGQEDGAVLFTGGATVDTLVNTGLISAANTNGVSFAYYERAFGDDIYTGSGSLTNSGTIVTGLAGGYSVLGGNSVDTVLNTGLLIGNVALGGGDDLFDSRQGMTQGTVYGGDGDDTLYGSNTAADVLDGGAGYDYLNGGGGSDTAYYFDYTSPDGMTGLTVSLTDPNQNTGDAEGDVYVSIENLGGTAYNDSLTGDANANTISGYGGDDVISGNGGADTMIGGSGDDTYYVDNVGDAVIEKVDGGNDTILSSVSYSLHGRYVETLTLSGTANINATGNDQINTLNGNAGNNVLDGKAGADTMSGGLGDDTYYVDDSNDNVVETSATGGNDAIFSSASYNLKGRYVETLTLTGSAAIDATGNNQVNTLVGNSGANTLDGQGGNDKLTGGGGADTFLFDSALSGTTNVDTITDFSVGADMIALDRTIFTAIGGDGTLTNAEFFQGTAAQTSTQHIIYDPGTGNLYYDKDGNGASAKVEFAHIASGLVLSASSFTGIH